MSALTETEEFQYIHNEVMALTINVRHLKSLFPDEETVSLLNTVSPDFFCDIKTLLVDSCILSVSKLVLDGEVNNLTIKSVINEISDDEPFRQEMLAALDKIVQLTTVSTIGDAWSWKQVRNKRVVHPDEMVSRTFFREDCHPLLYNPSAENLFAVVDSIVSLVNSMERKYRGGYTRFFRSRSLGTRHHS